MLASLIAAHTPFIVRNLSFIFTESKSEFIVIGDRMYQVTFDSALKKGFGDGFYQLIFSKML